MSEHGALVDRPANQQPSAQFDPLTRQLAAYATDLRMLWHEQRATRAELEAKIAELELHQRQLVLYAQALQETNRRLRETYLTTIGVLGGLIESRDDCTGGHCVRVAEYCLRLAPLVGLAGSELEVLKYGALVHDVGKIAVPDAVLLKPGPLTPEEREIMMQHPEIGYQRLREVEFLQGTLPIVRYHHERYDGTGYPNGLRGEQIPLGARIFALADTFDAMTSDRPYRRALPVEAALAEIRRCAGTQFDPALVEVFLPVAEQLLAPGA